MIKKKGKNGRRWKKNEEPVRQPSYSLYRSKKSPKQSIIIWSILFKNGNNLYEHWK